VQQLDGGFLVQHTDGSLTGDGFTNGPDSEPLPAGGVDGGHEADGDDRGEDGDGDARVSAGRTGTRFSGAGSAGAGRTGAGPAGAGKPGAFINTAEPLQRSSPPPPRPLRPVAAAEAESGEEDKDHQDQHALEDLDALVAEVRRIRPEWSSRSICRALAHPDVTERGWHLARQAMLAVAADPESNQPGRLAHGGPWWNQPGARGRGRPRAPWCGECSDERARQVSLPDGKIRRCQTCHPLARQVS
jgi:hypothetical protein